MTRHRARPSFTVEIKRTRNTPATPPDETTDRQRAAQALWKGTSLVEMTERAAELDEVFAPPVPRPASSLPHLAPKAIAPERRVLPSLIPAPTEPAEEPSVEAVPAPRRRTSPPRRRVLALVEASAAEPVTETAVVLPPVAPVPPEAPRREETASERSRRAPATRNRDGLRPGERWKRRLPRVLW